MIDWGLTALSAQIGYVVTLINMLQLQKSWQCYVLGIQQITLQS